MQMFQSFLGIFPKLLTKIFNNYFVFCD